MLLHCICQVPLLTPQQVLDALRALTECTHADCHEPLALASPPSPAAAAPSAAVLLVALWVGLAAGYVYGHGPPPSK